MHIGDLIGFSDGQWMRYEILIYSLVAVVTTECMLCWKLVSDLTTYAQHKDTTQGDGHVGLTMITTISQCITSVKTPHTL